MLDALGPGEIGDVNKPVDAVLDTDKHAEIGNILDLALDNRAHRVTLHHQIPGVGLQLLHTQGNALGVGFDIEHHHLD